MNKKALYERKKLLSLAPVRITALAFVLIAILGLLPVMTVFAALDDVVFTDNRGNKITIPGGAQSCATKVVSFTQGNPWTNDSKAMNPDDVLGVPDYDSKTETNYLCLGAGGVIVLEFGIYIYDGDGMDIYVFEIGNDVEATKVEVSDDLKSWIYVGDASGSLSGVDLQGKVPANGRYRYVRLTDIDGKGSSWPGADIDAVAGMCVKEIPAATSAPTSAPDKPTPTASPTPMPTKTAEPKTTPAPARTQTPPPGTSTDLFDSFTAQVGIVFNWAPIPGAIGYRVYRSRIQGEEGISITDFMITGTSYCDVNIDANTTYYYIIRAVLKEANVATGERELLGEPSKQAVATTGSVILGGNSSEIPFGTKKNVILMQLNNDVMSVNGIEQPVDPDPEKGGASRGTAPIETSGRTFVPIRSVIEAMGGTVGWDDATKQITLDANSHNVLMWLGDKGIKVDGDYKEMDVVPFTDDNSRTMVPVRFAAENAGCDVDWIDSTKQIVIVFTTIG